MIFPTPKKEVYLNGVYQLCAYSDTVDLMELYEKYKAGNEDVTIVQNADFSVDEYEITINEDGIRIITLGNCGVFRAISSLRQLLKVHGASLPYCEIHDDPDFQKRSYMLDISRCRMPKVSTITRLIDQLAELKYNEFQLYMESFVMPTSTGSSFVSLPRQEPQTLRSFPQAPTRRLSRQRRSFVRQAQTLSTTFLTLRWVFSTARFRLTRKLRYSLGLIR